MATKIVRLAFRNITDAFLKMLLKPGVLKRHYSIFQMNGGTVMTWNTAQ